MKLFQHKQENTKVELTIGTVWAKPLPMSMLHLADKLANKETKPAELAVTFALIMKAVLRDEDGKPLEDVDVMTADELADAFPVEDFTTLISAIMPSKEVDDSGN